MIASLAGQQFTMLLLALGGFILYKAKLISPASVTSIINVVIYLFMSSNILYSFLVSFDTNKIANFAAVLGISTLIQVISILFGKILYTKEPPERKAVLQFATVNSNSILMGSPIAESIYGSLGMSYASIYTIPSRIVMWSTGVSYFTRPPGKWAVVKVSLTHPCMLAVLLGMVCVWQDVSFPGPVFEALKQLAACVTPASMLIIGITLAEVKPKDIFDRSIFFFTFIRLGLIPLTAYLVCRLLGMESEVTGVSVLLTAMPAGATTTIVTALYKGNSAFASQCVVFTTIVSFGTTMLWTSLV
jgi:predicted permease